MKPYYSHSGITIYCADCLKTNVLPDAKVDLLLTDPPYGIGTWSSTGGNSLRPEETEEINKWDNAPTLCNLRKFIDKAKYSIVWGGNYFELGPCRAPLVWDKGIRGMHFTDGEMAWTNFDFGTLRIFTFNVANGDTKGRRQHPTQKPLNLMKWCIRISNTKSGIIVDPFMGSGTTLVAAKAFGLKAIGIEIEEKYCEIAAKRLSQEQLFPSQNCIDNAENTI